MIRRSDDRAFLGAYLLNQSSLLTPLIGRWSRTTALTDEDREAILALPFNERWFARDSYMVREGEPTTSCTVLVSGFAYRQKLVSDGARQIISIHIPGEFVDLQNGLLDVADHNVQSLTRSLALLIPIEGNEPAKRAWELVETGTASWSGGKPEGSRQRPSTRGKSASAIVLEDRR